MANLIARNLPTEQLVKLNFLLGEFVGEQTLYPPGGSPVRYPAHVNGSWEACERFVTFDFYADIPGYGTETFRAMITFSESTSSYRMWVFAASQEEPLYLRGNFDELGRLIFVSEPTQMVWGTERLRYTFSPHGDGSTELLGERWEPDGYATYCSVVFRPEV